jgi:radical SAM protein with 4Fe4S-binding SPASM domain
MILDGQTSKLVHSILTAVKSKLLRLPSSLQIEPISLCNVNCLICSAPQKFLERNNKVMSFEDYKKLLDKLKGHINQVTFFVGGEPFLNPELCKMIKYASKNKIRSFVSTNGTLLENNIDKILDSKLDILYVCLDGATKETHEAYRKGANFDKIVKGIKSLVQKRNERNRRFPIIVIQTLVSRLNENQLHEIELLAKNLKVNGLFFKSIGIIPQYVSKSENLELIKKLLPENKVLRYDNNRNLKLSKAMSKKCGFLNKYVVLSDGRLSLCCYDINGMYNIGNAFKEDITKLWKSKKYKTLRKKMKHKRLSLCKRMCVEAS